MKNPLQQTAFLKAPKSKRIVPASSGINAVRTPDSLSQFDGISLHLYNTATPFHTRPMKKIISEFWHSHLDQNQNETQITNPNAKQNFNVVHYSDYMLTSYRYLNGGKWGACGMKTKRARWSYHTYSVNSEMLNWSPSTPYKSNTNKRDQQSCGRHLSSTSLHKHNTSGDGQQLVLRCMEVSSFMQ